MKSLDDISSKKASSPKAVDANKQEHDEKRKLDSLSLYRFLSRFLLHSTLSLPSFLFSLSLHCLHLSPSSLYISLPPLCTPLCLPDTILNTVHKHMNKNLEKIVRNQRKEIATLKKKMACFSVENVMKMDSIIHTQTERIHELEVEVKTLNKVITLSLSLSFCLSVCLSVSLYIYHSFYPHSLSLSLFWLPLRVALLSPF